MNYRKALNRKEEIAPQGASRFFILPAVWTVLAFAILAMAAFASTG